MTEKTQKDLNKQESKTTEKFKQERDHEPVEGIFKFYEVPGGTLSFSFKKYKGDQVENYTLIDGQRYKIPLMVAKHLNQNGWYPIHAQRRDESNKPYKYIGKKVRRFGFQSLDFGIDVDEPMLTEMVEMKM